MSIERFDMGATMNPSDSGSWVKFSDHNKLIITQRNELVALRAENSKLHCALQKVVQDVTDAVWRVV